jgi:hypothetical protein
MKYFRSPPEADSVVPPQAFASLYLHSVFDYRQKNPLNPNNADIAQKFI